MQDRAQALGVSLPMPTPDDAKGAIEAAATWLSSNVTLVAGSALALAANLSTFLVATTTFLTALYFFLEVRRPSVARVPRPRESMAQGPLLTRRAPPERRRHCRERGHAVSLRPRGCTRTGQPAAGERTRHRAVLWRCVCVAAAPRWAARPPSQPRHRPPAPAVLLQFSLTLVSFVAATVPGAYTLAFLSGFLAMVRHLVAPSPAAEGGG